MRTNIEIDDELMAEAMAAIGAKTKRETVNEALLRVVRIKRQSGIREMRGKLQWTGDLESMRLD